MSRASIVAKSFTNCSLVVHCIYGFSVNHVLLYPTQELFFVPLVDKIESKIKLTTKKEISQLYWIGQSRFVFYVRRMMAIAGQKGISSIGAHNSGRIHGFRTLWKKLAQGSKCILALGTKQEQQWHIPASKQILDIIPCTDYIITFLNYLHPGVTKPQTSWSYLTWTMSMYFFCLSCSRLHHSNQPSGSWYAARHEVPNA